MRCFFSFMGIRTSRSYFTGILPKIYLKVMMLFTKSIYDVTVATDKAPE